MKLEKFLIYNQYFVAICATWASVNDEFSVPENKFCKFTDDTTILWSFIIIITSWVKFITFNPADYERCGGIFQGRSATLSDLFKLDYLPYVNKFAKIYYALVIVTVGVALIWRLYMRFWRPAIQLENDYSRIKYQTKKESVQFFLEGPVDPPTPVEEHIYEEIKERPAGNGETNEPRYLSSILRRRVIGPYDITGKFKTDPSPEYTIPVRTDKTLLADCSTQNASERWLHIAFRVYAFFIVITLISIAIVNEIYKGLRSVTVNFGWEKGTHTSSLADALQIYGYSEMIYAVVQGSIFAVYTNVFNTLCYSSVVYIHGRIHGDLKALFSVYVRNDSRRLKHNGNIMWIVRRLQLQTCAHFDHIYRLDSFVSRHGMFSIITFVVVLLFSTSIMRVEDRSLQSASISVLVVNGMAFAYIFVLSYHIEAKNDRMRKTILSLVAREHDYRTKRNWNQVLHAFYSQKSLRTFTMGAQIPLNLSSLFAIQLSMVLALYAGRKRTEAGYKAYLLLYLMSFASYLVLFRLVIKLKIQSEFLFHRQH